MSTSHHTGQFFAHSRPEKIGTPRQFLASPTAGKYEKLKPLKTIQHGAMQEHVEKNLYLRHLCRTSCTFKDTYFQTEGVIVCAANCDIIKFFGRCSCIKYISWLTSWTQ